MTVVLPLEYKVLFYGSKNLKDWSLLSEFANQGDKRKPWECPSLTELPVEGSNTSKWVLMLSSNGSTEGYTGMQYFVGDFDGKNFTNLNAPEQALYVDYGKDVYAGIPYNGLPKEQATLVAWMTNLNYTGDNPTFPWRGQMTIPRKLSLKNTSSGLRLVQAPAISSDFLEKKDSFEKENFNIKNTIELSGGTLFADNAYLIEAEIEVKSANKVGFKIAQEADSLNSKNNKFETKVYYDTKKKSLILDRLKSSVKHHAQFPSIEEANYELKDGVLKLQILVDRMSVEVFANDGLTTITDLIFPSEKAKTLSIFTENGKSKVRKLKIWNLKDKSK
jgi:sucrose-6-phosphate hydrolase SacC (GH32 family)